MKSALLSVSDKAGLIELGKGLIALGHCLYATGGTHKHLRAAGVPAIEVSELTQFAEILGGRVKTLHPIVFGGILAERCNLEHQLDVQRYRLPDIQVVVVNLYPFAEAPCVGNIDIGGPTLLRAAAKNCESVVPVWNPAEYDYILRKLAEGGPDLATRNALASDAFGHCSAYDDLVAQWFASRALDLDIAVAGD